jgi:hypothetical protein
MTDIPLNIPLVGQPAQAQPIGHGHLYRTINCSNCGAQQKAGAVLSNGGMCISCNTETCAFCGCTTLRACIHPDFPNGEYTCKWQAEGVCDFCHSIIAEEMYLVASGRAEIVRARYAEPLIATV